MTNKRVMCWQKVTWKQWTYGAVDPEDVGSVRPCTFLARMSVAALDGLIKSAYRWAGIGSGAYVNIYEAI